MLAIRGVFISGLWLACVSSVLAQSSGQHAALRSTPGCQLLANEFYTVELCPVVIPPMAQVQVDPPPPLQKRWPSEDCRTFRPRLPQLYRFWAQAGQISGQAYMHYLDWAACGASGTVTLQDGRKADWHVSAARMGTLRIEGEEKALYLFCPGCNFAPFWDWNTDAEFLPVKP